MPLLYINAEELVFLYVCPSFQGSGFRLGLAQTFRGKSATLACVFTLKAGFKHGPLETREKSGTGNFRITRRGPPALLHRP
jgi:hypothetical protein